MHDLAALGLHRDGQACRLQEGPGPRAGGGDDRVALDELAAEPHPGDPAAAGGQLRFAVPDHGAVPDRGPGQRGRQLPAIDPGRAADVHRGGVRPQRREQPLRVRAGQSGHLADLRCRGAARQQRLAELLPVFFALGQGERADLPVAHAGFAEIGQAGGQRRVLAGSGVSQRAPRRVRHLRGPRADDARSGRGGLARHRGVHQHHLGAERAGRIRT